MDTGATVREERREEGGREGGENTDKLTDCRVTVIFFIDTQIND